MSSLWKLKPYVRPYLWLMGLSLFLAIPLSFLRLGPAPLIRYMLDDLLIQKDASQLLVFPALLIGLYVLNFFVRFAHYYLLRIVIIRVNQKIKNNLFKHILKLSVDYFTAQTTGQLISRTYMDPQAIDSALGSVNLIIREPVTLLILFGYALFLNWKLTLLVLILVPPLVWLFYTTGKYFKRYLYQISEINGVLLSGLQESYSGIRMIKVFHLESYVLKKFFRQNEKNAQLLLKTSFLEEASHPLVEVFTAFALAPIAYYGGLQVLNQKMTPGDLFAFFTTFAMMMNPLRLMNDINIKINQASVACDRVFQVFNWKSHLKQAVHPLPLEPFQKAIHLKNVSFAYPDHPERLILKNISFSIPHGQVIALVGKSGAGKSSLIHLLPRLFDVTAGAIEIDGRDIREVSLKELQDQMAIVNQDVFLLNDTILENIRCGRLSATLDEVYTAARRAHALEFIENLPQGFETVIGDRGQKLSGGEKQRLSIARAFLREAPLLILDEATSSLDAHSENAVQKAIEELMQNRTTLVIAHRLSTIRHAHEILVMKEGEIIERGTHAELIQKNTDYSQLYALANKETV